MTMVKKSLDEFRCSLKEFMEEKAQYFTVPTIEEEAAKAREIMELVNQKLSPAGPGWYLY